MSHDVGAMRYVKEEFHSCKKAHSVRLLIFLLLIILLSTCSNSLAE
jgi:hypothetical protein